MVRALAATLSAPRALPDRDRQALAAEVMARLDAADAAEQAHVVEAGPQAGEGVRPERRNLVAAITFSAAIAAAAVVVLVALGGRTTRHVSRAPDWSGGAVAAAGASPAPVTPASGSASVRPPTPVAGVTGSTAVFERVTTAAQDRVRLVEGALEIDARVARPIQIISGAMEVAVPTQARASVVARGGVIQSVAVFAGSVEIVVGDRRQRIEAGATWERSTILARVPAAPREAPADPTAAGPEPAPAPADVATSLSAFRDGWTALRAGDHRAAIAAFDHATDPVVAEDAAYWAANATERAGDRADAARRYADFIARFPASPRAEASAAAIVRLRER